MPGPCSRKRALVRLCGLHRGLSQPTFPGQVFGPFPNSSSSLPRPYARPVFSQEDLADSAGIDRTYVSALERSRHFATVEVLQKLADALGIEAWTLLQQDPA